MNPTMTVYAYGNVDALRDEIAERLDARGSEFWLTIDFTADPAWT